jgi:hypothetical protein
VAVLKRTCQLIDEQKEDIFLWTLHLNLDQFQRDRSTRLTGSWDFHRNALA